MPTDGKAVPRIKLRGEPEITIQSFYPWDRSAIRGHDLFPKLTTSVFNPWLIPSLEIIVDGPKPSRDETSGSDFQDLPSELAGVFAARSAIMSRVAASTACSHSAGENRVANSLRSPAKIMPR